MLTLCPQGETTQEATPRCSAAFPEPDARVCRPMTRAQVSLHFSQILLVRDLAHFALELLLKMEGRPSVFVVHNRGESAEHRNESDAFVDLSVTRCFVESR